MNIYETGLAADPASHVALSPLSFLARSADIYPDKTAIVHGARRLTWADVNARCRRVASALAQRGVGKGDTVAILSANLP